MKKKNIPVEFVFQMFALIIAVIVIHGIYVSVIRPNAAQVIAQQDIAAAEARENDVAFVRERSIWVLVRDLEQEALVA